MKNKRRDFLKQACAPVVMVALGIPVMQACGKQDDNEETNATNNIGGTVSINLSESQFSSLSAVGGWMNYTAENLLLIRISNTQIRAFDNACPHEGNRDKWSFANNTFTCSYHNNSFENNCNGSLRCYQTSIADGILTVKR